MTGNEAPIRGEGKVQYDLKYQWRKQIENELQSTRQPERAETKAERARRKEEVQTEADRMDAELDEIRLNLETERLRLQHLVSESERGILTADEGTLEALEAKINVSRKKVAALENVLNEKKATLQAVRNQIAVLDRAARQAQENDSEAALLNEITARWNEAIESILAGFQILPELYRALMPTVGISDLSAANQQQRKHRVDIFEQDFRLRIVEDLFKQDMRRMYDYLRIIVIENPQAPVRRPQTSKLATAPAPVSIARIGEDHECLRCHATRNDCVPFESVAAVCGPCRSWFAAEYLRFIGQRGPFEMEDFVRNECQVGKK
jgi:hypothetical protein